MEFVIENIRLRELVTIVNENQSFYVDFTEFLSNDGYENIHDFINETDEERSKQVIMAYLDRRSDVQLYNGMGEAYSNRQARWMFISWILRDAPAQRLSPLVRVMPGNSVIERRANLLNNKGRY